MKKREIRKAVDKSWPGARCVTERWGKDKASQIVVGWGSDIVLLSKIHEKENWAWNEAFDNIPKKEESGG